MVCSIREGGEKYNDCCGIAPLCPVPVSCPFAHPLHFQGGTGIDGDTTTGGSGGAHFNYNTVSPVLDVYATNSFDLGNIPPGRYLYQAVIHDILGKKKASHDFAIDVVP